MATEGRPAGSLHGQTGHVVGLGAMAYPVLGQKGFVALCVVRIPDQWVICRREGIGDYDWKGSRLGLGAEIRGEQFADSAERGLPASGAKAVPFSQVQLIMEQSFPQGTFEWLQDDNDDNEEDS